jgi:predicted PurR-regulated permease PerM
MPDLNFVEDPNQKASLYQASFWSIFWRNFLAGFSRALGGLLITVVLVAVVTYISFKLFWPQLEPLINTFTQATQNLQDTNRALQQTQSSLNSFSSGAGGLGALNQGSGTAATGTSSQGGAPSALSPSAINQLYQELQGSNGTR